MTTGKQVGKVAGNRAVMVKAIAFAPDSQKIVTTMDKDIQIWNWQENKLVRTVATSYVAETLHWAETGIFAAGSDLGDKTATLWNPQTAGAVKTVTSTVVIGPTAMSQDGKTLAVYHPPQGLSVWTLAKT